MCSFFPSCREEREEEEQQKLKEQHDIPASSLQSPGKTVVQVNGIDRFATWSANVPSHIPCGSFDTFLERNDLFTSHVEK